MAKIFLICGKICSGKTTYAKKLTIEYKAVLLSCDEITLALYGEHIGEQHDEIVEKTQKYLFHKALEIIEIGVNVILDFGFWTHVERQEATEFFTSKNIKIEWHYVDVSPETWQKNLEKRNNDILTGQCEAYFIDENLARKFQSIFEKPTKDEINVWYVNGEM